LPAGISVLPFKGIGGDFGNGRLEEMSIDAFWAEEIPRRKRVANALIARMLPIIFFNVYHS
jgi:hypothetical protein